MTDLSKLREKNLKLTKQRVKESEKTDNLIAQAVYSIKEINKAANLLSKRLREWYELYNPEFSKSVTDHEKFAEKITKHGDRKNFDNFVRSMGMELKKDDVEILKDYAESLEELYELREDIEKYLDKVPGHL